MDAAQTVDLQTSSPSYLFTKNVMQKRGLEHFKHVINICPSRGHFFQNRLRNMWTTILKTSAVLRLEIETFSMPSQG